MYMYRAARVAVAVAVWISSVWVSSVWIASRTACEPCEQFIAAGTASVGPGQLLVPALPQHPAPQAISRQHPGPQAALKQRLGPAAPRQHPGTHQAAPRYEHTHERMQLPQSIRVPTVADCPPGASLHFIGITMYSRRHNRTAARLLKSCNKFEICCVAAFVPSTAFGAPSPGGAEESLDAQRQFYMRLILTKPLFILQSLRASSLPVVWLDADMEFMEQPTLFRAGAWKTSRDALLINHHALDALAAQQQQQAEQSKSMGGEGLTQMRVADAANLMISEGTSSLSMSSGVAFFNKTAPAEALLRAWAEAMAYKANYGTGRYAAADDQMMDKLANTDGWIGRASFGWLPRSYLFMNRLSNRSRPVILHDQQVRVGTTRAKLDAHVTHPTLPPHVPSAPDK
jgi:hypothetical protein